MTENTKPGPSWQQHRTDDDGDHDPEACYPCLLEKEVKNECRCGECCERLIIETTLEDAEREPLIAEKGSPIYMDERLTASGKPELEGYMLSDSATKGCVFLNADTKLCGIYDTRPLACRLFDCEGDDKQRLVQLGILSGKSGGIARG